MTTGEYIKHHRQRTGLSLRELEKRTGVSFVYLSALEKGRQNKRPGAEVLYRLAKELGMRMEDLLGLKPLRRQLKSSGEMN